MKLHEVFHSQFRTSEIISDNVYIFAYDLYMCLQYSIRYLLKYNFIKHKIYLRIQCIYKITIRRKQILLTKECVFLLIKCQFLLASIYIYIYIF